MKEAILDPIHTFIYITFMLSACALFSKTWIEVSGSGPRDVAKQLKDQQMVCSRFPSLSSSSLTVLIRSWPDTVRVRCTKSSNASSPPRLPSAERSLVCSPSPPTWSGAIGSGTGILMAVTIIYSCEFSFWFVLGGERAKGPTFLDWEIGMRESAGADMGGFSDLL